MGGISLAWLEIFFTLFNGKEKKEPAAVSKPHGGGQAVVGSIFKLRWVPINKPTKLKEFNASCPGNWLIGQYATEHFQSLSPAVRLNGLQRFFYQCFDGRAMNFWYSSKLMIVKMPIPLNNSHNSDGWAWVAISALLSPAASAFSRARAIVMPSGS